MRRLRPPAALAIVALIAAGCSGAPADNGGRKATHRDKAVRFSECMRAHGIKEFPDPDAAGELTIDAIANGTSLDTSGAAFEHAMSACRDLEPPGFTGHERNAQEQDKALRFAQCIRANGVKDFPDPARGEPLVDTRRIPSTDRPGGMSILNAAMQKCGDALTGLVKRP